MHWPNVIDTLRDREPEFPDLPAVIEGDQAWTYRALYDRVDRLSQALLARGVTKGGRLLAWLPNCHEAIECELACFQCGAVWVTLHAGLTPHEVGAVAGATQPSAVVTTPRLRDRLDVGFFDSVPLLIVRGDPDDPREYESVLRTASPERPDIRCEPSDIARLRYTSGTTGQIKAAVLTHRAYSASLATLLDELPPLGPNDRAIHIAPLTHATAAYLYPMLATGGANIVVPAFDAAEVLRTIERERASVTFVVPTILQRLADAPGFAQTDLTSLRSVSYGGAPTPPDVLAPWLERIAGALMHIYGLTEALHPLTTLERNEHYAGNPRLGSVGKPTRHAEIRIVDDAGVDVPDCHVGEFWVRGPMTMTEYWNDPDATDAVLHDGWIATGDLGRRDEDGYLWILDRVKDVIISGGLNVHASEVEAVLTDHPGVAEASVVGVPDPDWGEAVHAVIAPAQGARLDTNALAAHCRERLAPYKCPKRVHIWDALPRTGTGKIIKPDIKTRLLDHLAPETDGDSPHVCF